ncbi:uncharacterized protein LOC113851189 [Abrus precatorius]|uniref:Uncharacterized protein LOC113851189 n=1 Tax=Abrus precatorius TaxID=3816 RepID=A0A8B8K180_ABRPR|nr:uncharacterized protein LOC113851189 [Abrus precatorius]
MGLNVKDTLFRLFRAVNDSTKSSYTFLQRHPLVSGALLVCLILYIFLSYIYHFLVYMSPFLVCVIIFIRIFWSSEQTQLKYVKREEVKGEQKVVEPQDPKKANNRRHELLYKYPSHNATSRRRNFSDKKWDVYGGLEEKAKDLSAVFINEFTKRNTRNKEARSFEKGESSLDYGFSTKKVQVPRRQTLRSEPSMVDLVECGDVEIENDDDEEEGKEDRNKAIEWTEDDQKNLMNLGISEMERNKRLESLIARRKARKQVKMQLENSLNDKTPIAPVLTSKTNPFDPSKDFEDDLEMPGSAPSLMPRSPYDFPYDPSEEKPNFTGDHFLQDFSSHQKDVPFCRHESFSLGHLLPSDIHQGRKYSDRLAYSRFRGPSGDSHIFFLSFFTFLSLSLTKGHADKGNHDWLIDQLIYNENSESGLQPSDPLRKGEGTTHEEDEKCKTDMVNIKEEKMENDHETKFMSDQVSEPNLVPNISNIETDKASEQQGLGPSFPKPHKRLLNLPISNTATTSTTTINDSIYDTVTSIVDKRQENMFLTDRRLCHTPTYSIASDLQVEVSEIGSPASTVDENAETSSSPDRDSILYDGDIDKGVSSGSEDLWGTSFHGGREPQEAKNEEDNADVNNISKGVVSPIALRQIDEENVADVSSLSSKSDVPEDTPTYAINSDHNIFGFVKNSMEETEAPQSSNASHVLDQLPNETLSERPQERCNLPESVITEAQVINEVNNSEGTEQDNIENSRSNEDPPSTLVVRQESIDDASIFSNLSSPRSVLPEKTIADEVPSSPIDQHMHIDSQQSIMESMDQETLNSESLSDTMHQTIQPLMDDTIDESHNVDFNHSQEQTNLPENSTPESNIFDNINGEEVCINEEKEKLKNDENSEDNSNHPHKQEATTESTIPKNEIPTLEDMNEKSRDLVNEKSRDLVNDKVSSMELIEDDKNDKPSSSNNS